MKIVWLDYEYGKENSKGKIFVVAASDKDYDKFYSYNKIARKIKDEESVCNIQLNRKKPKRTK